MVHDMTTPLLEMVCYVHLSTKFEVSISNSPLTTKIWKVIQNVKNGVFWVAMGHSRSLKIATFDTAHMSFYWRFIVPVLHRFWDKARYWSKITAAFNLSHLCLAPRWVDPVRIRRDLWHQKSVVPGRATLFAWS